MATIRNLSLNSLVLVVIALVALLSTSAVQYQNYRTSLSNELKRVEQKHLLVAENLSFAIDRYLADLSSVSSHLWKNFQTLDAWNDVARDLGILGVGYKADTEIDAIFLTDDAWTSQLSTSDQFSTFLETGGEGVRISGLINVGDQQLFALANTRSGTTYFTLFPLDYIREIQASIQFGERGHSAIFDQNGSILAHPSAKLQSEGANLAKLSVVQQMMNGETGVAFFYSPPMDADMVAGFTSIEKSGWGIMVPQPIMEIEQGVIEDIGKGTLIGAVALLLFIFIGYLLAKRLTSSITRNISDLKSISIGDDVTLADRYDISRESIALSQALVTTAEQVSLSRARLSEALEAARENIRQRNLFIDSVNHRVRTPLNGIAGAGQLLEAEMSQDELEEYRGMILSSVYEIAEILEEQFEQQELVKQDESS